MQIKIFQKVSMIVCLMMSASTIQAQLEPNAGNWATLIITSGKDHRLPDPGSYENEIAEIIDLQKKATPFEREQIKYWNAGWPSYRWQDMINSVWASDTGRNGMLAYMLTNLSIYEATVVAWDTKYAHKRMRPFEASKEIKRYVPDPRSPSFPCEHSVAAGAAVTIISKFYPALADSAKRMAEQIMQSRILAGVSFPSDTRAGYELGKQIAERQIEFTKDFVNKSSWDGKRPQGPANYKGKYAYLPMLGTNKTMVLSNASQFRPGPPPDYAKEMEELKSYKQTFRSLSNAFAWANKSWLEEELDKKIFENNIHLNAPMAAKIFAIQAMTQYDALVACWDAKYTYWGIRPNEYDPAYKPSLIVTPPFPGYPSGHAVSAAATAEVLSLFFPAGKDLYRKKAKEAAESRFQAGIHFRSDNEVGLELGKKVTETILNKLVAMETEKMKQDAKDIKKN